MMRATNEVARLRRSGTITAAMVAVLAGIPGLTILHNHRWMGFICIGIQVVLLAVALSFLAKAKRVAAEAKLAASAE